MSERKNTKHESFGMIGISHYQSPDQVMFGSSIKHRNGIRLSVKRASVARELSRNWYYAGDNIVEVYMSQSQFAELITTPNVGDGVPCTIGYVGRERMEPPPFEHTAQKYRDEFAAKTKKVADGGTLYMKEALDILENKPTISKGDRETIKSSLRMLMQEIESNMPYLQQQFHEQMDKTIVEAKSEIEAFVEHKIRSVGIEGIKEQTPLLPE